MKKRQISKQQDSLCSFLKSKMNVELVYITLVGICQFYNDTLPVEGENSSSVFISRQDSSSTLRSEEQGTHPFRSRDSMTYEERSEQGLRL